MDEVNRKVLELTSFSWHGDVSGVNSPEIEFVFVAIPLSLIKSEHESYHRVLEFKNKTFAATITCHVRFKLKISCRVQGLDG